ncbi:MAG: LamG-like jellyroll fold domain-containing protein [Candidatus Tumulicola sp.]
MDDPERVGGSSGFGMLLRQYRLAAGLSQEALAERARMSTNGIGALERGYRRWPQRETLAVLAEALGLNDEQRREFEAAAARPPLVRDQPQSKATPTAGHLKTDPSRQVLALPFFVAIIAGIMLCGAFLFKAYEKRYAPARPSSQDLASLSKGLRAYWPIDDGGSDGRIVHDVMHRYDGKVEGVANWQHPNGMNNTLRFDGLSTLVSVPERVIDTSKSYSISAVIFPFDMARREALTVLSNDGLRVSPFYLQINRYQFLEFALAASDAVPLAKSFVQATQQPPLTGSWTHVVGTYDAVRDTASIFVNGIPADKQPIGPTFRAEGPLVIGASEYNRNLGGFFYGYIAQVYIYDRVLTDREIAALDWLSMQRLKQSR